jgi:hypothetical protein
MLTGRAFSEDDRSHFEDRVLPDHEVRARAVRARLSSALAEAKIFANDFRIKLERRELPEPAYETRTLLTFIDLHAPSLLGVHAPLATLRAPDEEGWQVQTRGRVVSLLGSQSFGYWTHLGLSNAPTTRTMALATILLGCRVTVNRGDLSDGITVARVIELETNALRAQARRKPRGG